MRGGWGPQEVRQGRRRGESEGRAGRSLRTCRAAVRKGWTGKWFRPGAAAPHRGSPPLPGVSPPTYVMSRSSNPSPGALFWAHRAAADARSHLSYLVAAFPDSHTPCCSKTSTVLSGCHGGSQSPADVPEEDTSGLVPLSHFVKLRLHLRQSKLEQRFHSCSLSGTPALRQGSI